MINEHGSAQVFEGLCQQLEQLNELRLTEAELKRVRDLLPRSVNMVCFVVRLLNWVATPLHLH